MPRHVAFLRGMNLGGRRISNADLSAAFAAIGLPDATCFRASGNVIFDAAADAGSRTDLSKRIEDGLRGTLGYEVPVFLRSAAATRAIAAFQPFPAARVEASKGKPQVILLAAEPPARVRDEVLAHATDADALALEGSELYWLPSGGTIDSALDLQAIAKLLGGLTTMRTKGTIELIAARHCAD